MLILVIWAVVFLPMSLYYANLHSTTQLAYYPSEAAPVETTQGGWGVDTGPVPYQNGSQGRLFLNVSRGESVTFSWAVDDYTAMVHIGRVNVYYETSWGQSGKVRLRPAEEGDDSVWEGEKEFTRDGGISYYYRMDKGDIPRFDRRASVIAEGGNLYEDVRTGPPPLINFFFVIPHVLAPSVELGGFFLSFYLYFSLFFLVDALLLFYAFEKLDGGKALLASILFLLNPISLYSVFQDEGIIAFSIILSIYLISRNRKRSASVFIGLGVITKIWSGFLVPIQLFYRGKIRDRLVYLVTSVITAVSVLSLFYLLWGHKVLWFVKFYGGGASKSTLGGVSIWARLADFSAVPGVLINSTVIIIFLGVLELLILYVSYRKELNALAVFTCTLSVFLIFYPKIHWEYYVMLLPTLLFYVVRDKRFAYIFFLNMVFLSISRGVRNLSSYPDPGLLMMSFLATAVASALLLWGVYLILGDKDVPKFRFLYEFHIGLDKGEKSMDGLVSHKKLVDNVDWKYMIVLDACRHDYFEKFCGLKGSLKRAGSPAFQGEGAPTSVWYRNVFTDRYDDIIHISSHPRVNSNMMVEGFEGGEHFGKIYDIWDSEWNEEMGTVLPVDVCRRAKEIIEEYPDKRFIIHFMQPHTPYLSLGPPSTKKKRAPESRESLSRKLRNKMVALARNMIGDMTAVRVMSILGLPPLSPMDDALRKVGEDGVKRAYGDNLKRALYCIKKLLKETDMASRGKVIITADHGELLGENGRFGHEFEGVKELVEVPWFELGGTGERR